MLFACGRPVEIREFMKILELSAEDVETIIQNMKMEYESQNRGIEIIKIDNGYQLCSKKEYYEYIYPILDKRAKPNLSQAAIETLAIIAYNQPITRAEVDEIRGLASINMIRKLMAKDLIKISGKSNLPGKPNLYRTTSEFLDYFGLATISDLPDIPLGKTMDEEQELFTSIYKEEK